MNRPAAAPGAQQQKQWVLIAYVLHCLAPIFVMVSALAGVVVNYLQVGEVGPPWAEHHRWMIRTFWWTFAGLVIGSLTTWILIGWVVLGITTLWWIYRMVRGLLRLSENRSPWS